MSTPYQPRYTDSFMECVNKLGRKKKFVEGLVRLICADPYVQSHPLGTSGDVDLTGFRSRHFERTSRYVIVFQVREEEHEVVFVAVGLHDDMYSREWSTSA